MRGLDCCSCRYCRWHCRESSYPARVHRISARRPSRPHASAGRASWPGPHSWWPPWPWARAARSSSTAPAGVRAGPPHAPPGAQLFIEQLGGARGRRQSRVVVSLWLVVQRAARTAHPAVAAGRPAARWTARATRH